MNTRAGRSLVYLATILSLGHHADHVVRGNHVGWPLTGDVTAFTYSLGVYPLIVLGLYLSLTNKAGPGYWLLLSGPGAVFLATIHLGPTAVEPPADIIDVHSNTLVGWAAFAWMLALIAVLVIMFVYESRLWWVHRRQPSEGPAHDPQAG